jgi:uncharacterized protein (TIGR03084 family)
MTDDRLLGVLSDLAIEGDWLEDLLAGRPDADWRRATPAAGWDVATSVGHLAWTDEVAVLAATDKQRWDEAVLAAVADPEGFVDTEAHAAGAAAPGAVLARWHSSRSRLRELLMEHEGKLPWFGPPMSPTSMATARYMETWAHGLDIAEALDVVVEPHDRVRHVVHLGVRTRGFSFVNNGLPAPESEVRVELRSPGGAVWEYGPAEAEQRVTGAAWDFARLVTQRGHHDDLELAAVGEDAERWLGIAQAFAGPSGPGRPPRSRP